MTPRAAREIQERLRSKVTDSWDGRGIEIVVGTDVSYPSKNRVLAAAVAVSYPRLKVIETVVEKGRCTFPYVPGLLSFREIPVLAGALEAMKTAPDVILCDGQGMAHPRAMGLACHLGLVMDRPTIGCAKSRLYGEFDPPAPKKGSRSPLRDKAGETVGVALRTRDNVSPVFVSVGHKIDLTKSIRVVLTCSPKYRIPEPLRMAHKLAGGEPV